MSRLRTVLPRLAADAALAAVVVVVGQLEVWAPSVMHPGNLAGPRWIISVGYFAVGALVAIRRIWPLGAIAAAFGICTWPSSAIGRNAPSGSVRSGSDRPPRRSGPG